MTGGTRALLAFAALAGTAMLVAVQCSHKCSISGSSYDQSCTQSSDCVQELAGDFCTCGCACGGTAINVRAQKQYESDLSDVTSNGCVKLCPCPAGGYPVCVHGTCELDGSVFSTPPDAGADAGRD
jgi:hypothetical protein